MARIGECIILYKWGRGTQCQHALRPQQVRGYRRQHTHQQRGGMACPKRRPWSNDASTGQLAGTMHDGSPVSTTSGALSKVVGPTLSLMRERTAFLQMMRAASVGAADSGVVRVQSALHTYSRYMRTLLSRLLLQQLARPLILRLPLRTIRTNYRVCIIS